MNKDANKILAVNAEYGKQCIKKWHKLLVAENAAPIQDYHTAMSTAILLENQSKAIRESINDTSVFGGVTHGAGGAIGNGDNYAKGDNRIPKTLLPLIRRTVPELIAFEVVGVQPMSSPVGLAFAMRFHYEKGPLHVARSAGTISNEHFNPQGYHFGVGTVRYNGERIYNPAAFNYAGSVAHRMPTITQEDIKYTNKVGVADQTLTKGVHVSADDASGFVGPLATDDNLKDLTTAAKGDPKLRETSGKLYRDPATDMRQLEATVGKHHYEGAEMGYNYLDTTYTGRLNEGFNRTINPQTGNPWTDAEIKDMVMKINEAGGDVDAFLTSVQIAGGKFAFSDQDLGTAAITGDYEATGRIPKTRFNLEKTSVTAGTRRIAANWTLELEQDIRNMQGIDVENEITSMISYELTAEIDREMVVRMMYAALSHNEYTFYNAAGADARWMGERDRVIYQYILQQANRMAVRNRRGPANFIIATPDVCSLLEALPFFSVMPVDGNVSTSGAGVAKVGTIGNGRFTIYRDTRTPVQNAQWMNYDNYPYMSDYTVNGVPRTNNIPDYALLGYKGQQYWDAGIIFCPYIPIMLQRVVDPVSWEPSIGLMTRYGVVDNIFGSHLYYHVVFFDTLTNTLPTSTQVANTFPTPYNQDKAELTDKPQVSGYPVQVANTNANPVITKPAVDNPQG